MSTALDADQRNKLDHAQLGAKLRARRRELGLTLQHVADGAGLSVGFISQIERGITIPSLASLANVSRVLGQHFSSFLTVPSGLEPVTRVTERPHYSVGAGPVVYERISAVFDGSQLTSLLIHHPAGYRAESMSHDGEELFYILSGALTVEVAGSVHVLEQGDSLHFLSHKVHSSWNHTSEPVVLLHVCTMDVFGERESPAARKDEQSARGYVARLRANSDAAPRQLRIKHADKPNPARPNDKKMPDKSIKPRGLTGR